MIKKINFGCLLDNIKVSAFCIENKNGIKLTVSEYGAAIVSIYVPDKNGILTDVVLGFDNVSGYQSQNGTYFGAVVGRYANRIRNSSFVLNGKSYILNKNDGNNHLHGGIFGFDKKIWNSNVNENSVVFTLISEDGEEGYPGKLEVRVKYTLDDSNNVIIDYYAKTDKDTIVNLTNHSYFNLNGHDNGKAEQQFLMINSEMYTCIDNYIVPNGLIESVEGTPLDFRVLKPICKDINSNFNQIKFAHGYDHNWILNKKERDELSFAGELYDKSSGRIMKVYTTKPGIQFYSGNFLDGTVIGKNKVCYYKYAGVCLETQYFPNSTELLHFPSPILKAGDVYHHITKYTFSNDSYDKI